MMSSSCSESDGSRSKLVSVVKSAAQTLKRVASRSSFDTTPSKTKAKQQATPSLSATEPTTASTGTDDVGEIDSNAIRTATSDAAIAHLLSQFLGESYSYQSDSPTHASGHTSSAIPHCRQLDTWDCGVACMQMILRWLRPTHYPPDSETNDDDNTCPLSTNEKLERRWLIDAAETESIWTIDIVILLQRLIDPEQRRMFDFPITEQIDDKNWKMARYLFLSTNLGCDSQYSQFEYYANAFRSDKARVGKRFALARDLDLPMHCVSWLDLQHVVNVISREDCIAVVLLDNDILRRSNLDEYAGHYILVIGVSNDPDDILKAKHRYGTDSREIVDSQYCIVIKNPSSDDCCTDFVTPTLFERAWRAAGTDCDIVFVKRGA